MNKCFLYGNVGKDPEIKVFGENKKAKFSLATKSFRKDESGNKVTDFHNIVAWGKLADLAEKYIKKGSAIIIEGEIQYGSYTDKEGTTKYFTEISASAIQLTGKKETKPEEKPDNKEGEFVKESRTSAKQDIVDQSKKDAENQDELSDLPF